MSRTKKNLQEEDMNNNNLIATDNDDTDVVAVSHIDTQKAKIRSLISGIYQIQKTRVAVGNQIVQSFNIQIGQAPSTKQEDLDKATQSVLEQLRKEYKKITDAYINQYYENTVTNGPKGREETIRIKVAKNSSINKIIEQMNKDVDSGIVQIKSGLDYDLMKSYAQLCDSEETQLKVLDKEVKAHYLWNDFFKNVKGCGTLMAAVCLAYFDVDKARHVSSFWRYAGLDTVPVLQEDGTTIREGRSTKHAKYTQVEYTDKNGETKIKNSLGYNPLVKTKLVGVLADCMIKAGLRTEKDKNGNPVLDKNGKKIRHVLPDAEYVETYLNYRTRLDSRVDTADYSDIHKHRMATRYMMKQFLRDLWTIWRSTEGYAITEPYEVAKLGHKPHKYNEAQHKMAQNSATS